MADPTNRNDPAFANNPNYVFSGGRWQAVSNPQTANQAAESPHVTGDTLGTPGGMGQVLEGLWNRARGSPFAGAGSSPGNGTGVIQVGSPNAAQWQQTARDNATRQQGVNPYNNAVADQSRPGQLALLDQMRASAAGPSIAGMQGQRALAQNGQQALQQAAMGQGRSAMLGAGNAAGGLSGDVAQARLGEQMKSSAGIGGLSGSLRGNDLRSADASYQSGLNAQQIADQKARFYAQLGSGLQTANDRSALEGYKLTQRIGQAGSKANADGIQGYTQLLGTLFGMGGSK